MHPPGLSLPAKIVKSHESEPFLMVPRILARERTISTGHFPAGQRCFFISHFCHSHAL